MEFFIKQNATLPVLKMQVVKDGRAGYYTTNARFRSFHNIFHND
jgi:hypothetical protein